MWIRPLAMLMSLIVLSAVATWALALLIASVVLDTDPPTLTVPLKKTLDALDAVAALLNSFACAGMIARETWRADVLAMVRPRIAASFSCGCGYCASASVGN